MSKTTSSAPANKIQNADSNSGSPMAASNVPAVRFDERTNRRRVDVDPSATPLPLNFKPAAEDSEAAVTMDQSGAILEVRVFKTHPQLAKVEATRLDEKHKAVKVYMRSGKVVEIKTDKIERLETISSKEILAIAGIPHEPTGTGRPRLAGQK
ncbi:MAG: hypothetical protein ABIV48_08175 [Pyrinomonadaceae bacterium]